MVGDVELNRMGGLAKLGGEFGQRFGIAVDQDDAPARSHDGAGDCTSQPAGRTGQKHRATAVFGHDITSAMRSEEHTSELQSLMRISYAVFCLKKKNINRNAPATTQQ